MPGVTHFNELAGDVVAITAYQETGAAVTGLIRARVPFDFDVYEVSASTRAQAGAAPTVDVQVGGATVLTGTIACAAGATTEGTLLAAAQSTDEKQGAYAKGSEITVNTTIGTSYSGLCVMIYLKKKN